jgi:hypothetical protein
MSLSVILVVGAQETFPPGATIVPIAYAPESRLYLPRAIELFNQTACLASEPTRPDGSPLETRICIDDLTGGSGFSSGTFSTDLIRQITNPATEDLTLLNKENLPIIFQPSTTHWLRLVNRETDLDVFDFSAGEVVPTSQVPVTVAIWESRLQAIETTLGKSRQELGWAYLLDVLGRGWHEFGFPDDTRNSVWYVQTNPTVSSTGLSVLLSQYQTALTEEGIAMLETAEQVNDLRGRVSEYQTLVRHYMPRTTEMRTLFRNGVEYVDFAALEEYDLIHINRGTGASCPVSFDPVLPDEATDRLVALYPRDGVVVHEHPLGIVQEVAGWGTQEQRDAAQVFAEYVISEPVQTLMMNCGLRPRYIETSPELFNEQSGVLPELTFSGEGETDGLNEVVFPTEVIGAVLDSWTGIPSVRKPSDLMILFDISESMLDTPGKLANAQRAVRELVDALPAGTRVGLTVFSSDVVRVVDLGTESSRDDIKRTLTDDIGTIFNTDGQNISFRPSTELYAAIVQVLQYMEDQCGSQTRICNVILVSDGYDERSSGAASQFPIDIVEVLVLENSTNSVTPVNIFPLAYDYASQGQAQAELAQDAISRIANASRTQVFEANLTAGPGDDDNILNILRRLVLVN